VSVWRAPFVLGDSDTDDAFVENLSTAGRGCEAPALRILGRPGFGNPVKTREVLVDRLQGKTGYLLEFGSRVFSDQSAREPGGSFFQESDRSG